MLNAELRIVNAQAEWSGDEFTVRHLAKRTDILLGGFFYFAGDVCMRLGEGGDEPWVGADDVADNGNFTVTGLMS